VVFLYLLAMARVSSFDPVSQMITWPKDERDSRVAASVLALSFVRMVALMVREFLGINFFLKVVEIVVSSTGFK